MSRKHCGGERNDKNSVAALNLFYTVFIAAEPDRLGGGALYRAKMKLQMRAAEFYKDSDCLFATVKAGVV